ncbi:MAG: hypothetical protein ABIL09_23735 [Gemmatimonadota bacterium]
MSASWRRRAPLLLGAAVCEAAYLALAALGDLGQHLLLTWAAFYTAFAAYALLGWWVLRRPGGSPAAILAAALLFRLTLLTSPPTLSDDLYRYLWDGRVQWAGINPFRHPPEAPELAPLRDRWYPGINHKDVPTIYPPAAQLFFLAATGVAAHPVSVKAGLVLCEAALAAALWGLLRRRGLDPRRLLLYAWNPLAVGGGAGRGHRDPLALALLFASLYWLAAGARRAAAAALGGAVLAKLVPLLAVPVLWRDLGRGGTAAPAAARRDLRWAAVVIAAGYGLYAAAGAGLFGGLRAYALRWRANDSLYGAVEAALRLAGPAAVAPYRARWACAALLLLAGAWILWRLRDPVQAVFALVGTYLLLTPTLHPWYVLWALPFLPLFPSPAWTLLSGLVFLAYAVLGGYRSTGVWQEPAWVRWAEYGPFYLVLARTWWRRRGRPEQPPLSGV